MDAALWPYGKCKQCTNKNYCGWSNAELVNCMNNDYQNFSPITHADRIRAMSDEELAATEMLCPYWASETWSCPKKYAKRKDGKEGYDCVACVLDWLKAPVEVDE